MVSHIDGCCPLRSGIGSGFRLGKQESSQFLPPGQGLQELLLLVFRSEFFQLIANQ